MLPVKSFYEEFWNTYYAGLLDLANNNTGYTINLISGKQQPII